MNKRFTYLLFALVTVLALALSACGTAATEEPMEEPMEEPTEAPREFFCCLYYWAVLPPSTSNKWPVTKDESSDARNSTALAIS